MSYTTNQLYWWILSLDGGGIRGLTTAIVLERLEKKLQQNNPEARLKDYFQMIAGSSTGSIIACGIAMGKSATELKRLYIDNAATIFPRKNWLCPSYYCGPIYDGKGLEEVLRHQTEGKIFQDLELPTLITTYDIYNRKAAILKNTKPEHYNIPVWEACRASSAAPILFPAHVIKDLNFIDDWEGNQNKITPDRGIPLIDGGILTSDPALCAIAERIKFNESPPPSADNPYNKNRFKLIYNKGVALDNTCVVSCGTGKPSFYQIGIIDAMTWGILQWINPKLDLPIVDLIFEGSNTETSYIAQKLLSPERYYRFQPELTQKSPLVGSDPKYLQRLEEMATSYVEEEECDRQLTELAKRLESNRSSLLTSLKSDPQ